MKAITKYKDEASGKEFDTAKKAQQSEDKHIAIAKLFAWVPDMGKVTRTTKDGSCDFENGYWCVQWSKEERDRLIEDIYKAIKKWEKWIVDGWDAEKHGRFSTEHIYNYYIGRCLSDGSSPIYKYYGILTEICPKCFRGYGQPYFAYNCHCDGTSGKNHERKSIPTRLTKHATPSEE